MFGVRDAPVWRKVLKENPLFAQATWKIMLMFSTDGVSPYKAGVYSMWPLIFKVMNLIPQLASKTDLLLLAGIIHGPHEPTEHPTNGSSATLRYVHI